MKTNSDTTTKLYIGLDVHKEQTSVAIAEPGSNGEIRSHGSVATSQTALEKLLRRLAKAHNIKTTEMHVCYVHVLPPGDGRAVGVDVVGFMPVGSDVLLAS